jgi:hypothetical protein
VNTDPDAKLEVTLVIEQLSVIIGADQVAVAKQLLNILLITIFDGVNTNTGA